MHYKPLFNTDGFSEYLDNHYLPEKIKKDFFRKHFKDLDTRTLNEIVQRFSEEYEFQIVPKYPQAHIIWWLPQNRWIWTTVFSSSGTDILLCWHSIQDVETLYSTLFHELVHANSYVYIDDNLGINRTWYVQQIQWHLYHLLIDEGMTDLLAGELFKRYCEIKNLPYLFEYSNLREIARIKRLIIFLAKKCGISRKEVKKILYSWYFNWINKNEIGLWKSIYKALSNTDGEFKMTDTEILHILDDMLN